MPSTPPPAGIAGSFSGLSAMTASVVRNSATVDAAFCSADRVTSADVAQHVLAMAASQIR